MLCPNLNETFSFLATLNFFSFSYFILLSLIFLPFFYKLNVQAKIVTSQRVQPMADLLSARGPMEPSEIFGISICILVFLTIILVAQLVSYTAFNAEIGESESSSESSIPRKAFYIKLHS